MKSVLIDENSLGREGEIEREKEKTKAQVVKQGKRKVRERLEGTGAPGRLFLSNSLV